MRIQLCFLLFTMCLPVSATVTFTPVAGSTFDVTNTFTGSGNGFAMGRFQAQNTGTTDEWINGITLSATGTGDDSTAFTEVGLFLDSNANGAYDPAADARYGAVFSAYPSDNGNLSFFETILVAPGSTLQFIIVAKLNGAVLPLHPDSFHSFVNLADVTPGGAVGLPMAMIPGIRVFSRSGPVTLEYDVSAAGPPYHYTFRMVLDNHDNSWLPGQGWHGPTFGLASLENAGTVPFAGWVTDAASYPIGPYNATWWSSLTTGSGSSFTGPYLKNTAGGSGEIWTPTAVGDELIWSGTANVFLNQGELNWTLPTAAPWDYAALVEPARRVGDFLEVAAGVGPTLNLPANETGGGNGFAIGAFEVISHSSAPVLSSLTIAASGSGDDSTAFSEIGLFWDSNNNGAYDPGVDQRFGQVYSAYPADNGSLTFTDNVNLAANIETTFLIVAKLNGPVLASIGQTFNTVVTGIGASGYAHSGLPTAVINGARIVTAPNIRVFRNLTVINNGSTDAIGNMSGADFDVSYTLWNTGLAGLTLAGVPVIASGANLASAYVLTPPATTIGANSTTFTIHCTPAAPGPFDFTVTIHSNSAQNNPMTWTVTGNATTTGGGNENGSKGGNDGGGGSCGSHSGSTAGFTLIGATLALLIRRRRSTACCRHDRSR